LNLPIIIFSARLLVEVIFKAAPDAFTTRVTKSVKGARAVIEAGFDFVLEMYGVRFSEKGSENLTDRSKNLTDRKFSLG
jgi:hypothetical protein